MKEMMRILLVKLESRGPGLPSPSSTIDLPLRTVQDLIELEDKLEDPLAAEELVIKYIIYLTSIFSYISSPIL